MVSDVIFWAGLRHFDRSLDWLGVALAGRKRKFTPVDCRNSHKFGGKNSFFGNNVSPSFANVPNSSINKDIANNLTKSLGMGLADGTWSKYKTSYNHMLRVQEDTGVSMSLPLNDDQLLWYISYLDSQRHVDSKTIDSYVSGLRMLHLSMGIHIPTLKSPIVKLALKGTKRRQLLENEMKLKPRRRAISLPILEFLSHQIAADRLLSAFDKQLYHTLCLTAFHGSFRMGELVSRQAKSYDSSHTLLCSDVSKYVVTFPDGSLVNTFKMRIKSPKVEKIGVGDLVEIFEIDSCFDPVAALSRYISMKDAMDWGEDSSPFFRRENGMCESREHFNKLLKRLLAPLLSENESLSCHSFRSGVASHMDALGFSSEEIKGQGRWSSSAWESYSKLSVLKRRNIASKLVKHLQFSK